MLRRLPLILAAAIAALSVAFASGAFSAASPLLGPQRSAQASVPGVCTDSAGVTVVVDFSHVDHGGLEAGCARTPPSSGYDAMTRAGFQVTQPSRTPGFVCRIDGQPASDPCVNTPPVDAYWSYWYSTDHKTWTYTSVGAWGRTPPPGSVDGWSFTTGTRPAPPGISPAQLAPPAAATTTTTASAVAPRAGAATPTTAAPRHTATTRRDGGPPPADGTSTIAPTSTTGTGSTTTAGSASTTTTGTPAVKARASVKLADEGGSGSPWGVIGGVGGAAVLAGGAGVVTHRRRAANAALDEVGTD